MQVNREARAEKTRKIMTTAQGVFAICYLIMAYYIITKKWFMIPLSDMTAYAFGGLLIIYGLYRLYRSVVGLR